MMKLKKLNSHYSDCQAEFFYIHYYKELSKNCGTPPAVVFQLSDPGIRTWTCWSPEEGNEDDQRAKAPLL